MSAPYRQIRADFDRDTIVVYQAYRPEIADAAVAAQRFVPPFSLGRMTWMKPSFLWMMERCGWATKPQQERVLAVRITRQGFEEALAAAKLSSGDTTGAPVVVQWDPERSLRGAKLDYRSIQIGLGRAIVDRYVSEWTTSIRDLTPLVVRMRELRAAGEWEHCKRLLPREAPYPLPKEIGRMLGVEIDDEPA
jgi:hypothetical protein